jgi:hypothetical protein
MHGDPILAWRDTRSSPESRTEVALAAKAHRERHLADGRLLPGQQELGRLDPPPDHELPRAGVGALLEKTREMVRAHVDQRAQLRKAELSGQIRLHIFHDPSKPRPRQAARDLVRHPVQRRHESPRTNDIGIVRVFNHHCSPPRRPRGRERHCPERCTPLASCGETGAHGARGPSLWEW